jgi:hypothetical protein
MAACCSLVTITALVLHYTARGMDRLLLASHSHTLQGGCYTVNYTVARGVLMCPYRLR